MLGMANFILASFMSKTWVIILDTVAAWFAFLMAYICYRRAREVAAAIDERPAELHVIALSSKTPATTEPTEAADSEDPANIGHPV